MYTFLLSEDEIYLTTGTLIDVKFLILSPNAEICGEGYLERIKSVPVPTWKDMMVTNLN